MGESGYKFEYQGWSQQPGEQLLVRLADTFHPGGTRRQWDRLPGLFRRALG